ncbi:hypothetical protein HDU82_006298 [Entophlyctis luteolus]|nr:hypothetical protein HDU82_006298 [Entophlyctis luteolus]
MHLAVKAQYAVLWRVTAIALIYAQDIPGAGNDLAWYAAGDMDGRVMLFAATRAAIQTRWVVQVSSKNHAVTAIATAGDHETLAVAGPEVVFLDNTEGSLLRRVDTNYADVGLHVAVEMEKRQFHVATQRVCATFDWSKSKEVRAICSAETEPIIYIAVIDSSMSLSKMAVVTASGVRVYRNSDDYFSLRSRAKVTYAVAYTNNEQPRLMMGYVSGVIECVTVDVMAGIFTREFLLTPPTDFEEITSLHVYSEKYLIVGRGAEGQVELYNIKTACIQLVVEKRIGERAVSISAGPGNLLGSETLLEIVCVGGLSGNIFGIAILASNDETGQKMQEMSERLNRELKELQGTTINMNSPDQSLCTARAKLICDHLLRIYGITVESNHGIESVALNCTVPSRLRFKQRSLNDHLPALFSFAEENRNVHIDVTLKEGQAAIATCMVFLWSQPTKCVKCEISVPALCFHGRLDDDLGALPLRESNQMLLKAEVSLALIHNWISQIFPDIPETKGFINVQTTNSTPMAHIRHHIFAELSASDIPVSSLSLRVSCEALVFELDFLAAKLAAAQRRSQNSLVRLGIETVMKTAEANGMQTKAGAEDWSEYFENDGTDGSFSEIASVVHEIADMFESVSLLRDGRKISATEKKEFVEKIQGMKTVDSLTHELILSRKI